MAANKPGFGLHQIGRGVNRENREQQHRRLEEFRDPPAIESRDREPCHAEAQSHRHQTAPDDAEKHVGHGAPHARGQQELEDDHRQQRAQRIVDDAFPFEERSRPPPQADVAQQRENDRRPGDHHDRPEQYGHRPAQRSHVVRRHTAQQPSHRQAGKRKPAHARTGFAEFVPMQRQPTFEQDDCHTKPDDGVKKITEGLGRMQPTQKRTGHEAEHAEHDDGGPLQPPGDPLGAYGEYGHPREDLSEILMHQGDDAVSGRPLEPGSTESALNPAVLRQPQPPLGDTVDVPDPGGRQNQRADDQEVGDRADCRPQQSEPEGADLPADMGFEPAAPGVVPFDVVHHHTDDGGHGQHE